MLQFIFQGYGINKIYIFKNIFNNKTKIWCITNAYVDGFVEYEFIDDIAKLNIDPNIEICLINEMDERLSKISKFMKG